VLVVVLAVPLGITQGSDAAADLRAEAAARAASLDRRDVVLLAEAQPTPGRVDGLTRAPASWPSDGGTREGVVLVPTGSDAGDVVAVWFDGAEPTSPPLSEDAAAERAVVTGVFSTAGLMALAVVGHLAVTALLDRYRLRRWADEWRAVERSWSGGT
jgi:hypothetical protein